MRAVCLAGSRIPPGLWCSGLALALATTQPNLATGRTHTSQSRASPACPYRDGAVLGPHAHELSLWIDQEDCQSTGLRWQEGGRVADEQARNADSSGPWCPAFV